eukprot:14251413-Alexandrium_andersonii.AAC.1
MFFVVARCRSSPRSARRARPPRLRAGAHRCSPGEHCSAASAPGARARTLKLTSSARCPGAQ